MLFVQCGKVAVRVCTTEQYAALPCHRLYMKAYCGRLLDMIGLAVASLYCPPFAFFTKPDRSKNIEMIVTA
jgi:hypothetical protein